MCSAICFGRSSPFSSPFIFGVANISSIKKTLNSGLTEGFEISIEDPFDELGDMDWDDILKALGEIDYSDIVVKGEKDGIKVNMNVIVLVLII